MSFLLAKLRSKFKVGAAFDVFDPKSNKPVDSYSFTQLYHWALKDSTWLWQVVEHRLVDPKKTTIEEWIKVAAEESRK